METEPPTGRREHQFIDFTKGLSLVRVVINLRNSSPRALRVIVHVANVDVPSLFLRTCPENQISCFGVSKLPAYRQDSYFRTLESAPNSPEVGVMPNGAFQKWLILGNHHMGGTWGLEPWEHGLAQVIQRPHVSMQPDCLWNRAVRNRLLEQSKNRGSPAGFSVLSLQRYRCLTFCTLKRVCK